MFARKFGRKFFFSGLLILLIAILLPAQVYAQYPVDCSGADPNAYPTINAALAVAGSNNWITVVGTCNETVNINSLTNVGISALWQDSATIIGGISIQVSSNIMLFGLNVTNPAGPGIQVSRSRGVYIDSATSNGNAGRGLDIGPMSDVVLATTGSFSNNADSGIAVSDDSSLQILIWGSPLSISGNKNAGIYSSGHAYVENLGNVVIENTSGTTANGLVSGFGIDLRGGAALQMGTIFGSNTIQNNHSGGVSLQENSEASFWGGPNIVANGALNIIQNNGPVGITAGLATQVTFFDSVYITGHTDYGVDLYANSQLFAYGKNQVVRNGTGTELLRSGLRIDGNSEAYFRGGQFLQNGGPAITALVNSSVDLTGASFQGNAGGIITCDLTSVTMGDLAQPGNGSAIRCRAAHNLGSAMRLFAPPHGPDISRYQAMHDKWKKFGQRH